MEITGDYSSNKIFFSFFLFLFLCFGCCIYSKKNFFFVSEQPGPSKIRKPNTMVWVENTPEFVSVSENVESVNQSKPLDLSKSANDPAFQPVVWLKDIKSLLETPVDEPRPSTSFESSSAGPSWYVRPEEVEVLIEENPLKMCACGNCF